MTHYVLVGQTPVPEPDFLRFAESFETNHRVAVTRVLDLCMVSTIFLGTDHNLSGQGPPLLFETIVFWDGDPEEQERCATWSEAERQHAILVGDVWRPAYVFAWVRRVLTDAVHAARADLAARWRELGES